VTHKKAVLVIYLLIGLILFMGSVDSRLKKASILSKTVFYPFFLSVNNFISFHKIKKFNEELQIQLANQLIENTHLKTQLKKTELNQFEYVIKDTAFVLADVVGISGNLTSNNIIVNKGKDVGIDDNYPVLSSKGIVGKVIKSYSDFSIILPMNNPGFKLAVFDQSSNIQGLLETNITGKTYISFVRLGSVISIGDTIVTSNLSQLFPPGYPVGTITAIEESQDAMYIKGLISPKTNFNNLENVFILKPGRKENYENYIQSGH
jgi:rod shape-determining protein MreC